jgi:hypothetical protein
MVPAMGVDGVRRTVNSGISSAQAVWNLRSALNVAALNCLDPQYAPILEGYKALLKNQSKPLAAANKALDKEFKERFGSKMYIRERETYQTQVYNFFALPPVVPSFCNAAMAISIELGTLPTGQLDGYAYIGLSKAERPYREFFDSYEQYRADLNAWEARYGGGSVAIAAPLTAQAVSQ